MNGDEGILTPSGLSRCLRCGRWFQPRTPDQKYGPTCAKKLAGQVQLDSIVLVSGKVLRKGKETSVPIYIKDEAGEVTAVIL